MIVRHKNNSCCVIDYITKESTVLDLGCGYGEPFIDTNFKLLIGVDAWRIFDLPEYDLILLYDIKNIGKLIAENSFDVITCIDVIEHLEKEEGFKLIEQMERIARKEIYIFTPLKWSENKASYKDPLHWCYGNKEYNTHRSLWNGEDFVNKGYKLLNCQEGYVLAAKRLL